LRLATDGRLDRVLDIGYVQTEFTVTPGLRTTVLVREAAENYVGISRRCGSAQLLTSFRKDEHRVVYPD
jgi:hypothetical protein